MIEKFAAVHGVVPSEFLDLNRTTSMTLSSAPYDCEVRSGHWRQGLANFAIGAPA
jgi:hypothetical protein